MLLGTGISFASSLLVNYLLFFSETLTPFARSMITAIVVPIAVGVPLSLILAYNMQQVGRYRRALTRSAAYDQVTDVFKRTAFSSAVDRRSPAGPQDGPRQGAFLVVIADNLRSINLRYGLDWGEEALRTCCFDNSLIGAQRRYCRSIGNGRIWHLPARRHRGQRA